MFIVFDGINGSGKSTALREVARRLRERTPNAEVVELCNPTASPIGVEARRFIAERRKAGFPRFPTSVDKDTRHFANQLAALFTADRAMMQADLRAHLAAHRTVLCDRYSLSTLVYQCAMVGDLSLRGPLAQLIASMHAGFAAPDITFIFDLPVSVARARLEQKGDRPDDLMMAPLEHIARSMYLDLRDLNHDGDVHQLVDMGDVHHVDAAASHDAVVSEVLRYVDYCPF